MNYYQVLSGYEGHISVSHTRDITSYKEAEQEMLDQFKKPEVKECLIMKNDEPFEYMSDKGRYRL